MHRRLVPLCLVLHMEMTFGQPSTAWPRASLIVLWSKSWPTPTSTPATAPGAPCQVNLKPADAASAAASTRWGTFGTRSSHSGLAFSRPLLCPEEEAEQQDEFPMTGGTVDSFAGLCAKTREPWAQDCVPGVLMAAVGLAHHLQAVYFFILYSWRLYLRDCSGFTGLRASEGRGLFSGNFSSYLVN